MIKKRYLIALFAFFAFAANAHAISPLNIELEVNETSLGEIKGSFVLENRSNEAFTDLKYILSLKEPPKVETYTSAEGVETKETTYNNYLIKAERSAESITIGSGAEESRDFVFSYPKNLPPGDYEFSIDVVDGQVGDTLTFDVIESTQLQGLQNFLTIKENSCFVIKDEVEFFQEEGPNFDSGATPEAKCRVYNPSSNTIQFEGEVTYGEFGVFNYPNAGTKTVKSGNYTLGPKEEKEIIIKLPSLTKSQAYQAFVNFVDDKGDEISPSPSFRWIVKGEGARIVEIKTDKDFYETGDEANIDIDFVGSPDMWWQIFGDEEGSTLEGFDINVKMTDQEGTLCAEKSEPFSGRVEDGDLQTASVKLKIEKDCKNPKIAANFVKNGGVLSSQEKSFVSGDSAPQKELPWETVIVLTTVLLALIIASIIYKKKPTKISLLLLLFVLGILLYVFLAIEIQPNTSEAALTGKQVKRRCEEGRSSRDSFCFGFKQSKKKNNVALVKPEIQNVAVTTLGADGKVSEGSASNIIEGGNDDITKVSFYVNQEDKYLNFEIKMKYSYDFASGTGYLCSNSTPRQVQTEFGLRDFGVEIDKFTDIQRLGGSTWSDTKTINLRYSISEIEQAWPIIDPETGEVSIDPVTGEPRYYFGSSHPYGDLRLVTKTAGALQVKGKVYPGDFNLPPKVDNVAGQVPLYPPFTKQAGETISEVYQRLFDVYFDKRKKLIGSGEQPWTRIKLVHIGRRSTVKAGSNPPSRTINLGEKITLTALNGYDPDYKDYVNEYTWQYKSPSEDCDKFEKPRVWKKDSSLMFRFTKNTLGTNSCQGEKLENPPGSTKSNIGFVDNTDGDSSLLPATTAYFSPTQAGDYWFRVRSHSSISSPGYIDFGGRNNPNDNYVRVVVDEVLEPPMPDLIIESPAFDPPSPIVNTSIDFSGTVKNQGNADAASSATRLSIQKVGDSWQDISPDMSTGALIANGGSETESWPWTPTEDGGYMFRICADINGVVSESNETNNCSSDTSFTVLPLPPPTYDLTVNVVGAGTAKEPSGGSKINCQESGGDCSETYNENDSVSLTAEPDSGAGFVNWSGDVCDGSAVTPCVFNIDSDKTVTATFNSYPIAVINPSSIVVYDNDDNGTETVSLDGSSSSDPDGDPITYKWEEGAVTLGTGSSISPSLSVASHAIELTVTDSRLAVSTPPATATVIVNANTSPTADAGPDQGMDDSDGDGVAEVTLDGSGSFDSNGGSIVSYEWSENGNPIGSGVSPTISFTVADSPHTVALTVTDNGGETSAPDYVEITVNPSTSAYWWDLFQWLWKEKE